MRTPLHVVLSAAVLSAALAATSTGASVPAVQKVIQLLTDMETKAKQMKNAEAVGFSEFKQFCLDTAANKDKEIKEGNLLVESLAAEIGKLESDITELGDKIDGLQSSMATSHADLKAAKLQREKERSSYTEQIQDFAESADALERAITVLQKQNYDRTQASEALLQLSATSRLPDSVQRTVTAFLEMSTGGDYLTRDAPEAYAYEFQSSNIVDLLKRLRDEFAGKHSESEKEEMNSKHAFDMLSQDLSDAIERATSDVADKTAVLQEKKGLSAEAKKRLAVASKDLEQDTVYLRDLKVECDEKAKSFKEKQELRAGELEAMGKALEILRSPDVLGAAQAHLPGGASLAQLRATTAARPGVSGDLRALASHFLRSEGRRLHSSRLGLLAEHLTAPGDPFAKVKGMIEAMIQRLLREAGEESEHKGWCDTELGTNRQTRTRLQDTADGLTAKIDETEAALTQVGQRLGQLAKEVSELTSSVKEATSLREAEKAKNAATVEDALAAQKALRAATAILKDFYADSSQATALAQVSTFSRTEPVKMGTEEWEELANPAFEGEVDKGHKKGMQTFGATYRGQQDEAGGVLAMLEVIASDFATLEASTSAAEAEAARVHKDFLAASKKSAAVKEKEREMLTADRSQQQAELATAKKDLAATQDQLLAADRYYEKLRPSCVDSGMSYEERAKARQEEIQSLQEALHILSGEDVAA